MKMQPTETNIQERRHEIFKIYHTSSHALGSM
jgi:hypothetical protein